MNPPKSFKGRREGRIHLDRLLEICDRLLIHPFRCIQKCDLVLRLGMFGIEQFSAIIDPGQSAILAVGAAVQEPIVEDGDLKVKNTMRVTLSCDHRVIDGYTGTQYLLKLKSILEDPEEAIA